MPGDKRGRAGAGRGGPERPHLGVAVEHLQAVGRSRDIRRQVPSCMVPPHVEPVLPELARGHVDDAAGAEI